MQHTTAKEVLLLLLLTRGVTHRRRGAAAPGTACAPYRIDMRAFLAKISPIFQHVLYTKKSSSQPLLSTNSDIAQSEGSREGSLKFDAKNLCKNEEILKNFRIERSAGLRLPHANIFPL